MRPLIAIVGRPNVGKSTLFNRLVGRQAAVVDDRPGVTRDRLFADATLGGRQVILIDTGGFEPNSRDELVRGAVQQARLAVEEADLVLFLCDARDGLHPLDQEVAALLRKGGKPTLLVANKADPGSGGRGEWEFTRLGLEVLPVSALHGTGLSEMAARIEAMLPAPAAALQEPGTPVRFRLCLLGRPNVGKSSLVNRLVGADRQLVSPVPGTTRDAVDIQLQRENFHCVLVDTPGVRRKSKIVLRLEHHSVVAALRSIERADVAAVILDGTEPFSDQDARLLGLVQERGRGLLVVVNKADTWKTDEKKDYLQNLAHGMRFASYAPVVIVSARTGMGVEGILSEASRVVKFTGVRISTGDLNRFMEEVSARLEPPMIRGRRGKIYFITQAGVRPPTFMASVNDPERIPESYRRFLERRLRKRFPFVGTPLRWVFRPHGQEARRRKGRRGRRAK